MLKIDPNRKLVLQQFAEKTGKPLIMKDINNKATKQKDTNSQEVSSDFPVNSHFEWIKDEYPPLKIQVVMDSDDIQ